MAVTALEITARNVVAGGTSFGETGPYEQMRGTLHFAVDPQHADHHLITDLGLVPTGADGLVHFSSDVVVLQPVNPLPGGRLLYDVVNRGNKTILSTFNDAATTGTADEPDLGNGFLMRHGFTVVFCGWQTDVPAGRLGMQAPEAMDRNGRLRGQTAIQYVLNRPAQALLLSDAGHQPLPAADPNDAAATLTVREHADAPPQTIPRDQWQFARWQDDQAAPDPNHICLPAGFAPGKVYEVIYTTVGAPVIGLSFLAMRDCVSFLKYGTAEQGNPCAGSLSHAYGFGRSQSGRYLREFLYLGLNGDEQGRVVFDGVLSHTASSRRGEFNLRFGQPSTNILRSPGNLFPFTFTPQADPMTGETDGLLNRLATRGLLPKVMTTNSGVEYWWTGGSLAHTDVTGTQDVEPPPTVRVYSLAGTQHGQGTLPLTDRNEGGARLMYPVNTVDYRPYLRATLVNLDRWVREDVEPPPSQYPRLAHGTAVRRESLEATFRAIPGVQFPPTLPVRRRLDYGPEMARGIPQYPPKEGPAYGTVVSAVDRDGNEVAGVRSVDLRAPLGTYTGWTLRHPDIGNGGQFIPLIGATHLFPRTAEERAARGDPRPAIAERYPTREAYRERAHQACQELINEGYLLAEEYEHVVAQALARYDAFISAPRSGDETRGQGQ